MNNSSEPKGIPGIRSEAGPVVDADRVARTAARHAALAARVLPLPNLALRAGVTLLLLYGLLGLLLMMVSLTGLITPAWALGLGVMVAVVQYMFGPWMLDLTLPGLAFCTSIPLLFWLGGGRLDLQALVSTWSWGAVLLPLTALALPGLAMIFKNRFSYRRGLFPHETVAGLLGRVKVSGVRTVPVTLAGRIIGKGVPGLVWSEDFVLQDSTGIMLLDYRQPFGLWDFFFGAFRAETLQGQEVRVAGWYRRNPSPSLIIDRIEGANLAGPILCYGPRTRTWVGRFLVVAGLVTSAVMAVGMLAG